MQNENQGLLFPNYSEFQDVNSRALNQAQAPLNVGPLWPHTSCPLEAGMATHSSTLAWKIPWEEPVRLQSMGSQRVRHDWATWLYFRLSLNVTFPGGPFPTNHAKGGFWVLCEDELRTSFPFQVKSQQLNYKWNKDPEFHLHWISDQLKGFCVSL